MANPKISIITINLNNSKGLLKTIESVVNQTHRDFELIVIDGASTDESPGVIKQYKNELKFSVSEKDSGIYQAMNKGILKSSGEYLLFLNSGDWLSHKEVIADIAPHLHTYDVISGDIDIYDKGKWHIMKSEDTLTVGHFFRTSLFHQATFISRGLFTKYGLYDETFSSTGDYEFFIRTLFKNNGTYHHVSIKIANFIADGMSNDPTQMHVNLHERERSWAIHFSENVMKELKYYHQILGSKELMWARRINKLLPF